MYIFSRLKGPPRDHTAPHCAPRPAPPRPAPLLVTTGTHQSPRAPRRPPARRPLPAVMLRGTGRGAAYPGATLRRTQHPASSRSAGDRSGGRARRRQRARRGRGAGGASTVAVEVGVFGVDEALAEELLVRGCHNKGRLVVPRVGLQPSAARPAHISQRRWLAGIHCVAARSGSPTVHFSLDAQGGNADLRCSQSLMVAKNRVSHVLLCDSHVCTQEWPCSPVTGVTEEGSLLATVSGERQKRIGDRYSLPCTVDFEEVRHVARQNSKSS